MENLLIVSDARCTAYGSAARPEQPVRVLETRKYLRTTHPGWRWRDEVTPASDDLILLAHSSEMVSRLGVAEDFDSDTPYFSGIGDHARRSAGAALAAAQHALHQRTPAFSLMRPPGHHATPTQAMGFCYLNSIAITALAAQKTFGAARVAVWDFDAHHGNGTEAILLGRPGLFFASVHQSPGYPGTGLHDRSPNVRNWPIAPLSPREEHLAALRESFDAVQNFSPDLLLVSAGFDAYVHDPITEMTLEAEDFATLGTWVRDSRAPVAAILEGGYSPDLPHLIDAFLSAWTEPSK